MEENKKIIKDKTEVKLDKMRNTLLNEEKCKEIAKILTTYIKDSN